MTSLSGLVRLPQGAERRFGKFTFVVKLGWGGMADVYLATDETAATDAPVVVKRLKADLAYDPEHRAMFKDEARLALRLDHPNIVRAYETGEIDGQPFLTMEFLDGQPLDQVLSASPERRLTRGEVLRIMSGVLCGMDYAHELKDENGNGLDIVHRDVSPHNVFVTYEGRVKLVDFGIAKSRMKAQHTVTGVVKGKIGYMAPEQALSSSVDRRADVFAAGIIMSELMTAQPYWGDRSEVQILKTMTFGDLPSLEAQMPNASEDVKAILKKALSITADQRYPTARAFRDDIEAFIGKAAEAVEAAQVGESVAVLCAERRRALDHVLDRELGDGWRTGTPPVRQIPPSLRGAVAPPLEVAPIVSNKPAEVTDAAPPTPLTQTSDGQSLPLTSTWEARPRPRRVWPALAVGAVAFAIVVTVFVRGFAGRARADIPVAGDVAARADDSAAPKALGSAVDAPPDNLVTSGDLMTLHVATSPPEAMVSLDGTRLTGNPFTARFPKDGVAHRLTFDAPGYVHRAELVAFDHDVDLVVALDRARFTPVPKGSSGARSGTTIDERDPWSLGKPKR